MKKNQSVRSFKENLKRMLLVYSLAPVFQLMVLCVVIVLGVGSFFIISRNRNTNQEIAKAVEYTLLSYDELLQDLVQTPDIIDHRISTTKRQKIMRKLYTVSVDTGYGADLYLLDQDHKICMRTGEEEADRLEHEIKKKWKILDLLEADPGSTAIYTSSIGSDKRIYLGRAVKKDSTTAGYAVVSIPQQEFTALLSGSLQKNMLVDQTGWVFATSSYSFVDEVGRMKRDLKDKTGFYSYKGGSYYTTVSELWNGMLSVYTVTDNTDTVGMLVAALFTGFFVLFLVFLIAFSSAERMAVKSTADIREIDKAFQSVTEGCLDAYLDIRSSTEFENIGKCYNEMLDSLKRQIETNKELAETVAYAHVKQLESQFNSHFLFNTLDNIRFMCKIDADLAEFMTVSLSELLRYNTSNANEKVTVGEDLKYIRIYLEIMKVRFCERFDYQLRMEEGVEECLMPKLLLQPLIENAIKYGFGSREHLNVGVTALINEGRLVFICQDDGVGIASDLLEKLRHNLTLPQNESSHLGMYNVHRRIQLMYGSEYGMQVESEDGVTITVILPVEGVEGGINGEKELV
ncbi:sensor histidine kinase [Clostridium sp. MCC353]|uniref:cache domain-containing sensor histidine kinase n=1 Tax=Clostridium sp. MCC353 TaxID=2592646 RepID=UPI001C033583|nr:sensor histidine kinase [Clostridium sp. MCC353]